MAIKEDQRFISGNIFEGIVSFRALVSAYDSEFNDRRITKVYYSREKLEKNAHEFSYIKAKSHQFSFDIELCPHEKIDRITVGTSHAGIAIECSDRTLDSLENIKLKENGFYVMLEGIEDPYNFGYALRSMYAAGVDGVILSKRNWMSAAGIVCRSSAGASEQIPMWICQEAEQLEIFKKEGFAIVSTAMENSLSLFECQIKKPLLLVVGGEKRGISKKVLDMSDMTVRLDYARDFPAALSAASAASIICFEIFRQNR